MVFNSTTEYLQLIDELVDNYNLPNRIIYSLLDYVKPVYRSDVENKYKGPMFWIGMYIAFASLVCVFAMVADLSHALRTRKLWFPCKYFKMNAGFLIVMFVTMKVPVDLTGVIPGDVDQVGKLGSLAFMCTMMANLLPCLATMRDGELSSNVVGLCVLVVTIVANVCIQIQTGIVSYKEDASVLQIMTSRYEVKSIGISKHRNMVLATIYAALLLVLMVLHVSSCFAILRSKKILETKYKSGRDAASADVKKSPGELLSVQKLHNFVTNHWIMAATGSSQFVFTAYFPTTSASGVICVFVTILHSFTMSWTSKAIWKDSDHSDYSWSMMVILIVQSLGVVIGTIAPVFRCFASFKVFSKTISKHVKVFAVESYWTQKLYDWKQCTRLRVQNHKPNAVIKASKSLILSFCIEIQEGVVIVCKIMALIPFFFMICVVYLLKRLVFSSRGHEADTLERSKDFRPYVLQLEDELELAARTIEGFAESANQMIQKGEKGQPSNLLKLILEKVSSDFQGVRNCNHINDDQFPSLLSKGEYKDCWSLRVVTLTAIVVSLSKIERKEVDSLLKSVREGLVYVTIVEQNLNTDQDYVSLQQAAETLWQEVDVYQNWLGYKLKEPAFQENRAGQTVEWFRDTAKDILYTDDNIGRCPNDDLIICANSMYRITKTILHTYQTNIDDKVSQENLFGNLSAMIGDTMAACLTNLPQVITMKCHSSVIEKREESVKYAAQVLGETTQLIKTLQDHGIPCMNPSVLPFIHKWCAYLGDP